MKVAAAGLIVYLGAASAFRLTSLLPFWGDGSTDDADARHHDEDDPLGALAYPRRNLAEELGEETYISKLNEALGVDPNVRIDGVVEAQCAGGDGAAAESRECPLVVGVDASFPMHHPRSDRTPSHRLRFYDDFLRSCRERYTHDADDCDRHESDRLDMNRNQPRVMRNYTDIGVRKTRAPDGLYHLLREFWDTNRNRRKAETWGRGNTFLNHWDSPTYMVDLDNPHLPGGGTDLRNAIWNGARTVLAEWTGERALSASSLYGIRVYERGAVLAPHVDRLPLVTSAIINVDQDVDEPWPLEIIAHDGRAYNVTLEPGDMVLYESHSVIHGRPYPLKGDYYANVFVHFEPRGHSQRHGERMEAFMRDGKVLMETDEDLYRRAMAKAEAERKMQKAAASDKIGTGPDGDDDLPDYIARGTPEEKRWKQQFAQIDPGSTTAATRDAALGGKQGKKQQQQQQQQRNTVTITYGSGAAHHAASTGDLETIRDIAASSDRKDLLFKQDKNGWQPLHEAARGGYTRIVEVLLDEGADVNAKTNQGNGGNALWWAEKTHGKNHPVSKLLKKRGGVSEGPKREAG